MVSLFRYLCTDQQAQKLQEIRDQKCDAPIIRPAELNRTVSEDYASSEDNFSARSTPSTHRFTFQSMLLDIQNSRGGDLRIWTVKKMHQYTCYLSDRLRKSKAFKGYFLIICRLVDLLKQHLQMLVQERMDLPEQVDREALVMTLMCVQALNKVYGRRSDVRASCHILVEKVATDFSAVTETLKDGLRLVNPSLQISVADFIVPRDSRQLLSELKHEVQFKTGYLDDKLSNRLKEGIIRILQAHRIRVTDFTQGDVVWLEREVVQQNTGDVFDLDSIQLVFAWLLHIVQPNMYPQPKYSQADK
eukprot:TRINITY_DN2254_c0_g1_i1.p5 TRINITY_DN2254_c0_g1~~TRINITY_DN2254_c0_g1_i1.p5  ORF type:complete len:303 (-),score=27.97 TRINITY_DN2254_c0_g1_i1:2224-3132(-)